MPEINLIDRSFNKENTSNYSLSIQADRNGLAFCVFDNKFKDLVVFRKYRFEHVYMTSDLVRQIIAILDKDDLLKLTFHAVHFLGYSQQSTLVPAAYFNSANLGDYLEFNIVGGSEGELFSNHILPLDTYNIFSLPRPLVTLVTLHFKRVEFSNQSTPFLWYLSHNLASQKKATVHISLNADFFDIAVVREGKLLLYNTFQYVNETDLLYYVLFVCKQLHLNLQEISLVLSGESGARLIYHDTLKQYIPAVQYSDASDLPPVSSALLPVIKHKYLNLLYLNSCALLAEHIKAEK
jgi:Protein of unknown function (DUF3822)